MTTKRPSFQFYPGDWLRDSSLRRCSLAARGAWMDVLCLMHDSEEYGLLRWPLADIAHAAGLPIEALKELSSKGVIKGSDGPVEAFFYVPRHANKDGDPVTLIKPCQGPLWYCARMVKDDYVRLHRGEATRFGSPSRSPTHREGEDNGYRQGDGASSAFALASALALSSTDSNASSNKNTSAVAGSPAAITLPLNDGTEYPISQKTVDELRPLYPAVDIEAQLGLMKGWLLGNRDKRKTKSGVMRFVTNWLAKAQNQGGSKNGSNKAAGRPKGFEQTDAIDEQWLRERRQQREQGGRVIDPG